MQEIIKTYEDYVLVDEILSSNDYLKFTINECTIDDLESKADHIVRCHDNIWKPLCIIYHPAVKVYDKVYYIKK